MPLFGCCGLRLRKKRHQQTMDEVFQELNTYFTKMKVLERELAINRSRLDKIEKIVDLNLKTYRHQASNADTPSNENNSMIGARRLTESVSSGSDISDSSQTIRTLETEASYAIPFVDDTDDNLNANIVFYRNGVQNARRPQFLFM